MTKYYERLFLEKRRRVSGLCMLRSVRGAFIDLLRADAQKEGVISTEKSEIYDFLGVNGFGLAFYQGTAAIYQVDFAWLLSRPQVEVNQSVS